MDTRPDSTATIGSGLRAWIFCNDVALSGTLTELLSAELKFSTTTLATAEPLPANQCCDLAIIDDSRPFETARILADYLHTCSPNGYIPIYFSSSDSIWLATAKTSLRPGEDILALPLDTENLLRQLGMSSLIGHLMHTLDDSHKELEQYRLANQGEQDLALHVLARFNKSPQPDQTHICSWLKSAVNLSGDVACIAKSPSGQDLVMLADSTGHGLAAAICTLPAIDIFHSLSRLGADVSEIACSINQKLWETLPTGHFVAAVIASFDRETRVLSVWNGGMPLCRFLGTDGAQDYNFESRHPPLGTIAGQFFDASQQRYSLKHASGTLLICSDGVTEARNPEGTQFSAGPLELSIESIRGIDADLATRLLSRHLESHVSSQGFSDDASLIAFRLHEDQ